ncbi:hypothetical protein A3H80_03505 [Candidatus Roizmanbacteria bacterium RIFCSPLOWO2_02_FULL_37_19]|nr:MAG: hypothetical protein A3E10_04950 [Candidatus Roizmanbacteria bacterium RIFCSPHIGHO2_12_FULL_37_23]OGK55238.1 MAG: hypothetical protein A3H80_03505 [Candidatus Roizmanbacteria bacterium RIFCSPLOWO2_02_FULL_37_19]OGK61792.1 MAG: hypothetical protein A3G65_02010 [Candidatus Roizmanbacteria bacterium RIFCSPLOWO2_12_FULL_37_7b]
MAKKSPLEKKVWEKLEKVHDPELSISIVDLGLIYKVKEKNGNIDITMTLTTLGCPLFTLIETEIKNKVNSLKEIKKISIELVFDPPWNIDMMSERGKAMMGI